MNIKAAIKKISATFSERILNFSFSDRIDKKESMQLPINKIAATPVNSSINVDSLNLEIFREVKTTRQNPNKLDDVFSIWDDLLSVMKIIVFLLFRCL